MRLGLLGPMTVEVGELEGPVVVSAAKERALLGLLALRRGRRVSLDALVDGLWPIDPPPNARKAVQTYVARLRKRLPQGVLASEGDGYRLDVDATGLELDVEVFERLVARGRAALHAKQPDEATRLLRDALGLWRGDALPELGDAVPAVAERTRLAEARRAAEEELLAARLSAGDHREVVGDAEAAVVAEPLRERRWALLMLALYRSGRQADALRAYQRCRDSLVEQLGVEPGPELRELERAILDHDRSTLDETPGTAPNPARHLSVPRSVPAVLNDAARTPMVGRSSYLRHLADAWKAADAGGRATMLLAGEPGVGKTRLAAAVAAAVVEAGGVVLVGRCHPELAVPYQPVAEALAPMLSEWPDDAPGRLLLATLAPKSHSRAGAFARFETEPVLYRDPVLEQYHLFEDAVRAVAAVTRIAPVLLIIEDLQWASEPTRRLLRYLITAPALVRLLTLGTMRHTQDSALPELGGLGVQRLIVGPLDLAETTELAVVRSPHGSALDPARLHELSGGNPLLVEQLLLDEDPGGRDGSDPNRTDGPRRADDVIAGRLQGLAAATREVLELAAVAGAEFDTALLCAAHGSDDEPVLNALEEAERAGLIVERSATVGRFAFCHALVRAVLAEGLPAARRMRLHRALGVALERRPGRAEHAATLARHFAGAAPLGLAHMARHYAEQAGDEARAGLAFEEAAELYALALASLESAPGVDDAAPRADLLVKRGEALRRAGSPEGERLLHEAALHARALGDGARLSAVVLALHHGGQLGVRYGYASAVAALAEDAVQMLGEAQPALRARLLAVEVAELVYDDDDERRVRISDDALRLARLAGDPMTLAHVLVDCLTGWTGPENVASRQALVDELVSIADGMDVSELRYRAQHLRSLLLIDLGDIDGYAASQADARRLADDLHQPAIDWEQLCRKAADRQMAGDLTAAEQLLVEAENQGSRVGIPESTLTAVRASALGAIRWEQDRAQELADDYTRLTALAPRGPWPFFLVLLHSEAGEHERAAEELDRLIAHGFRDIPRRYTWPFSVTFAAETAANLHDVATAQTLLALLRPLSGRLIVADHLRFSTVDRVLGRLCTTVGAWDEAAGYLQAAAAQDERIGAPLWLARTHLELARLGQARGDHDAARAAAERAAHLAGALGGRNVLARAKRVLGTL